MNLLWFSDYNKTPCLPISKWWTKYLSSTSASYSVSIWYSSSTFILLVIQLFIHFPSTSSYSIFSFFIWNSFPSISFPILYPPLPISLPSYYTFWSSPPLPFPTYFPPTPALLALSSHYHSSLLPLPLTLLQLSTPSHTPLTPLFIISSLPCYPCPINLCFWCCGAICGSLWDIQMCGAIQWTLWLCHTHHLAFWTGARCGMVQL